MSDTTSLEKALCTGGYTAMRFSDLGILFAVGVHPTNEYQPFFDQTSKEPPEFTFWHTPLVVIEPKVAPTPFFVWISFQAPEPIDAVVVTDAIGKHEVPVQPVEVGEGISLMMGLVEEEEFGPD